MRMRSRAHTAVLLQGWASTEPPPHDPSEPHRSVVPLLDAIVQHIPPPVGIPAAPFAMLVAMIERDAFLGRVATGRVASGCARVGDRLRVLHHSGGIPIVSSQGFLLSLSDVCHEVVSVQQLPCQRVSLLWRLLVYACSPGCC